MTDCTAKHFKEELSEVERQIIAIRLKCEEKVQSENERFEQVKMTREQCIQDYGRTVTERMEEHEQQLQGVHQRMNEQVARARQERQEALDRAQAFTEKAEAAEQRARELEKDFFELRRVLDSIMVNEDKRLNEVQREGDIWMHNRLEDVNDYVRNMARYCSEVRNSVLHSIETMHAGHEGLMAEAEESATQRSRYKDMHAAALNHSGKAMTDEEFHGVRSELSQGWYDDWARHSATFCRQSLWTDALRLEGSMEDPLKPADPTCPRPVESARESVSERLRE
eukprot:CAMPEP_0175553976 /NCGR_PEP_ID=MMETSP0096-20121207/33621_1 /TAXON_ID=311494 /ORGANISM="Alexandrium monilatum, Strain CCMP3105" /LENGTH=281 /DNA_ID=CAMNT_0016857079 /DNA_START=26 /DNA_END=868 /DNA_ORIENTATION=-